MAGQPSHPAPRMKKVHRVLYSRAVLRSVPLREGATLSEKPKF